MSEANGSGRHPKQGWQESAMERKPGTIVLVHGAWMDASAWTPALVPLAHEGYTMRAAHLPLESYEGDVAAVERLLDHVDGPVLLVGHSYGGAVVTAAGNHEKVKALGYLTAYAPEPDEVFGSMSVMYPAERQLDLQPDARGFLWLETETAFQALGHDLHRGYINLMIATQKPTAAALFGAKLSTEPAWKTKPSSYLMTTDDRVLAPVTQRALAKRIGARMEEVAASHLVTLSQPEAVGNFLRTSMAAMMAS